MSFRRAVEMTGISTLLFATAALIGTGCSSGSSASGTGGAPGTGGKVGTGGKTGSGGATASGGATGAGGAMAVMPNCTPLAANANNPVIINFDDMTSYTFGDFSTTLSGTLLQFNGMAPAVSTGAWVIDQQVTGYGEAGVGIDFQPCPEADMSAFTGLAFDISGTITPQMDGVDAGALPPQAVSFQVSTAEDDVASNYDAQNQFAPSFGLCVPVSNQYDGSCATPSVNVPLTAGAPVTKSYPWAMIAGGKGSAPNGRGTPDPAKITHLRWIFPYNFGNVPTPFHINLTIDNIRGLTAGGTTTDAGTDTTTPPPVDAAPDSATD